MLLFRLLLEHLLVFVLIVSVKEQLRNSKKDAIKAVRLRER